MARWLSPPLFKLAFGALSMVEQHPDYRHQDLSPAEGFFRRDRYIQPDVDIAAFKLQINGIARARSLTYADLQALEIAEHICVMECAGNGNHWMGSAGLIGQVRWSGPLFQTVLDAVGGPGESTHFAFHGCDGLLSKKKGYHYGLSLSDLLAARAMLALQFNGEPLPTARGFPVRLVVPGIYSMSYVKWLTRIEGSTTPHKGRFNRLYSNKRLVDGRWVPEEARWIGLKSLITRCRRVETGWEFSGWAWGGNEQVESVEITTDGGETWNDAELRSPHQVFRDPGVNHEFAPQAEGLTHASTSFSWIWRDANPGKHLLASRCRSATRQQPMEQPAHVSGHFDQTRVKWREVTIPAS
ncbi:MAG: molybdopterin-dependent oxidoreductase [Proteobacteria bacterium]|nr:molybdopterin-dependent oxidoreductase [Pseudomonadota bacterium]